MEKSLSEPNTLENWVRVLCHEEMPIFSNTALNVHDILNDEKKGAIDLASVILQDPNLTIKLLKISNSPNYNPMRHKMVTVSRAIIVIGFEVVRRLTLACSFFESILSAANKKRVTEEIARAILAATQAKSIAIVMKDLSPEEVFIAALLKRLGSICFWCFCSEQGDLIQRLIEREHYSREAAERKVLGFELAELGVALSDAWQLGGLIEQAIKMTPHNTKTTNPRLAFIQLGYDLTEALTETNLKQYDDCVSKIAGLSKKSSLIIDQDIKNNTRIAANIARDLGAIDAAMFIENGVDQPDITNDSPILLDKKQLQFNILQEIAMIINGPPNVNLLLESVLEGIHRGIGMDRTLFCMLDTANQSLKEKISFGCWRKAQQQKLVFKIGATPKNLFSHALADVEAFWAKPSVNMELYSMMDLSVIGKNECFVMPVFSKNMPIGLIYADREFSKQTLTEEDFNMFKYFTQQANIGITVFRAKR